MQLVLVEQSLIVETLTGLLMEISLPDSQHQMRLITELYTQKSLAKLLI